MSQPQEGKAGRLRSMLYHLGKGIWKGLPVIGPVVEEVVYEQFKEELTAKTAALSEEEMDRLLGALPSPEELQRMEERLTKLSDEERLRAGQQYVQIMATLGAGFAEVQEVLKEVQQDTREIPTLANQIKELCDQLLTRDQREVVLRELQRRRAEWVQRISDNQLLLLQNIPSKPLPLSALWPVAAGLIPGCTYKEFRFRLHELEWLDLVGRRHERGEWVYWRSAPERG